MYQTFLVLSSFTGFPYFVLNILPRIVVAGEFPAAATYSENRPEKFPFMATTN